MAQPKRDRQPIRPWYVCLGWALLSQAVVGLLGLMLIEYADDWDFVPLLIVAILISPIVPTLWKRDSGIAVAGLMLQILYFVGFAIFIAIMFSNIGKW